MSTYIRSFFRSLEKKLKKKFFFENLKKKKLIGPNRGVSQFELINYEQLTVPDRM